ncbi:HutD/Ves family protein [Shewanella baltica]|uniref:HutD/Ves family protein n=1 Tax=Shewanella baltica TaxID=62322 RepID=UPI003D79275D
MTLDKQAQLIRYQDCPSTPWKNGGGSTKQLLISPATADLTEFNYRISIASISSNGPFSLFNGVDRQLVILEGDGVELSIDSHEGEKQINNLGGEERILGDTDTTEYKRLTPINSPFCFAGETSITSKLLSSNVIDFNVMTKRGAYQAQIEKFTVPGTFIDSTTKSNNGVVISNKHHKNNHVAVRFILCLNTAEWWGNGKIIQLEPYDLLICSNSEPLKFETNMLSSFIKITITTVGP